VNGFVYNDVLIDFHSTHLLPMPQRHVGCMSNKLAAPINCKI